MTIKTLANGEDIKILSKESNWYKVSLSDGAEGWVNSAYITVGSIDKEGIEGITVSEVVDVRKGSSTNYGIVTKITEGNTVKIIDKDNNWYKVKIDNDQEGWVEASSISVQKIKVGMAASATILVNEKKDVLYLPVECISKCCGQVFL